MCLVLKSDNGKVVSIANEQNHRQTESWQHPVPYYNIDAIYFLKLCLIKTQIRSIFMNVMKSLDRIWSMVQVWKLCIEINSDFLYAIPPSKQTAVYIQQSLYFK